MNRKTALLVIDAQVGLIEGKTPVYQADETLGRINTLLDAARSSGTPVIYVQDGDIGGEGTPEWQIHPKVAPAEQDLIVQKLSTDAFYSTTLEQELQQRGIHHIVVTGFKTEYCVDTTCRSATTRGYHVTLVGDGHSTTDDGVITAEQIVAHHNCNLHGLDNLEYYIVVQKAEDVTF